MELPQKCSCGNVYMPDAKFCRKCGKRRVAVAVPQPVEPAPKRVRIDDLTLADSLNRQLVQMVRVNEVEKIVEKPRVVDEIITVEVPEYHYEERIREVPVVEKREVVQHVDLPEVTIEEELRVQAQWRREEVEKEVVQRTIREKVTPVVNKRLEEEETVVEVPVNVPALTVDRVIENHTVEIRPVVSHVKKTPELYKDEKIVNVTHIVDEPKVVFVPRPRTEKRIKEVVVPHIERVDKVTFLEEEEVRQETVAIEEVATTERIRYVPKLQCGDALIVDRIWDLKTGTPQVIEAGTQERLVEARAQIKRLEKSKHDLQVQLDRRLTQIKKLTAEAAAPEPYGRQAPLHEVLPSGLVV